VTNEAFSSVRRRAHQERKPAPSWLTMLQEDLTRAASIVGIILMVVGFAAVAYIALPMRLMMQAAQQQNINPRIPIVGGLALIGGIALLYVTDTRCRR
jgi:hypothetical protein